MPRREPLPKRSWKNSAEERAARRRWWKAGPELYDQGHRYFTLAQRLYPQFQRFLERKIGGKAADITAVEFGPGRWPLTRDLQFRNTLFVDSSEKQLALLRAILPVGKSARKPHIVKGDLRNFELPVPANNLAVVGEVFTFVRPEERLRVLERLARTFDRLLIIDRWVEHIEFAGRRPYAPMEEPQELFSVRETHKDDPRLVPMHGFAETLRQAGFKVDVSTVKVNLKPGRKIGPHYFVLWAEKGPGKRARIKYRKAVDRPKQAP